MCLGGRVPQGVSIRESVYGHPPSFYTKTLKWTQHESTAELGGHQGVSGCGLPGRNFLWLFVFDGLDFPRGSTQFAHENEAHRGLGTGNWELVQNDRKSGSWRSSAHFQPNFLAI